MKIKEEITNKVLSLLNPNATQKDIEESLNTWWFNKRKKINGGLRLTDKGYIAFIEAGIKDHLIKFDEPITFTNQLTIWLDQQIDCPFFLTNKEIVVFGEKTAVQLVLFSGNVSRFVSIKAKNLRSLDKSQYR